jgi:hypothetical protein
MILGGVVVDVGYQPKPYATAKKNAMPITTHITHQRLKPGLYRLTVPETSSPSLVFLALAGFPKRLPSLPQDHGQYRQGSSRVGPPPAEGCVETDPGE